MKMMTVKHLFILTLVKMEIFAGIIDELLFQYLKSFVLGSMVLQKKKQVPYLNVILATPPPLFMLRRHKNTPM